MKKDELKALFDQQASGYEQHQKKFAPIHNGLHFQLEWVFSGLPNNARILCVGLGTGAELSYLANQFPDWHFTAVEPSGEMLKACRRRAEQESFISRCTFHDGYLESLPDIEPHDAATCFMVSHFFLDKDERIGFFRSIASKLRHEGILASADLSSDVGSYEYKELLKVWVSMLQAENASADAIEKIHKAWEKDVAILPAREVESIIKLGGFGVPVQFYQASFVHAWFAKRTKQNAV